MYIDLRDILWGTLFIFPLVGIGCNSDPNLAKTPIEVAPDPQVQAKSPTSPTPTLIDFNLNEVRLGDPESHVLETLGKPVKRLVKKVDICGINRLLILKYKGGEIHLDPEVDGTVLEIHISDPSVVINPDFRVGETRNSIVAKFGIPFQEKRDEGETVYFGYLTKNNDNAELVFYKGSLATVRFYINPC